MNGINYWMGQLEDYAGEHAADFDLEEAAREIMSAEDPEEVDFADVLQEHEYRYDISDADAAEMYWHNGERPAIYFTKGGEAIALMVFEREAEAVAEWGEICADLDGYVKKSPEVYDITNTNLAWNYDLEPGYPDASTEEIDRR